MEQRIKCSYRLSVALTYTLRRSCHWWFTCCTVFRSTSDHRRPSVFSDKHFTLHAWLPYPPVISSIEVRTVVRPQISGCEVQSPVKNRYLTFDAFLYNCQLLSLGSAVVLLVRHRICDSIHRSQFETWLGTTS